jgi:hypothetical protein
MGNQLQKLKIKKQRNRGQKSTNFESRFMEDEAMTNKHAQQIPLDIPELNSS